MNSQTLTVLIIPLFFNINLTFGQVPMTTVSEKTATTDKNNTTKADPDSPAVQIKILRVDRLLGKHDNKVAMVSMIEVTFKPLAASMPHRHPGPVSGYVLKGTLEFQVGDQPLQTLHAGDTFFEPSMILHRVARNPDPQKRCRIIVTMIHPADAKRLVIPEMKMNVHNRVGQATKARE